MPREGSEIATNFKGILKVLVITVFMSMVPLSKFKDYGLSMASRIGIPNGGILPHTKSIITTTITHGN